MEGLLTAIVTWLAINFGLPENYHHPKIERMPAALIAELHYGTTELNLRRKVFAIYDDGTKKIILPHNWTGRTAAELSVLVHEMVHHLQNVGEIGYECAAAREKIAYAAQDRWLAFFGTNLFDEFELDPMTLKLTTQCMHY